MSSSSASVDGRGPQIRWPVAWLRLSGDPRHGYHYTVTPAMAATIWVTPGMAAPIWVTPVIAETIWWPPAWLRLSGDPWHGCDYLVTPGMATTIRWPPAWLRVHLCRDLIAAWSNTVVMVVAVGSPPTSCWEYDPMMNGGPWELFIDIVGSGACIPIPLLASPPPQHSSPPHHNRRGIQYCRTSTCRSLNM